MDYKNATSKINKQALIIEDAETRLLEIAKLAVLEAWTLERFKSASDSVISETIKDLTDKNLKQKAVQSLRIYVQKQYNQELQRMRDIALWAAVLSVALARREPRAKEYAKAFNKDYTQGFRNCTGFKRQFARQAQEIKKYTKAQDGAPDVKIEIETVFTPQQQAQARQRTAPKPATPKPPTVPPTPPTAGGRRTPPAPPPMGTRYYKHKLPLEEFHQVYMKRVAEVTTDLVQNNAKDDYTTNVSLRNIAEMTVRYDFQKKMVSGLKDEAVRLVYIVPHANCSARCAKYQVGGSKHPSGLYSLDGTRGKTAEGVPFLPLEFATENPEDLYTTREGKTYQNGCIFGFNCRHKLEPYKANVPPKPIPDAVIKKQREIEEVQREMERDIRYLKKGYYLNKGVNNKKAEQSKNQAKAYFEKYKRFCLKNKVAYYPERVKLLDDDF